MSFHVLLFLLVRQQNKKHVPHVVASESTTTQDRDLIGVLQYFIERSIETRRFVEPKNCRRFLLKHPHHSHHVPVHSIVLDMKSRTALLFQYPILVLPNKFLNRLWESGVEQVCHLVSLRSFFQRFVGLATVHALALVYFWKNRTCRTGELHWIESRTSAVFEEGQGRSCSVRYSLIRCRRFRDNCWRIVRDYCRHLCPSNESCRSNEQQ
mmetsp:Transcript_6150/g.12696  ORF Transcript_6150/g.12696 Transcript_6150/m.12696 type:complete len:210 (+) Transcript_6150:292-921(+)